MEKRDRILAAMDDLLRRRPFAAIGVADLAGTAGVSPATIYQRFDNADVTGSVLLALYYQRVEQWARRPRGTRQPAPDSLPQLLQSLAEGAWDQIEALGHVMRPAYLYTRLHPDRAGPEWQRLEQAAQQGFRALLQPPLADLPEAEIDRIAGDLAWIVNALLLGPLLHAEDPRWQAPDARSRFVRTLTDVVGRFIAGAR